MVSIKKPVVVFPKLSDWLQHLLIFTIEAKPSQNNGGGPIVTEEKSEGNYFPKKTHMQSN